MPADRTDHCWSRIGVWGDGTCVELARVVHCRNCEVYARAGRGLLEQAAPDEYLERWAAQLATAPVEEHAETLSTVVFRLASERFALPTAAFAEAVELRPVHRIPHRSGEVVLGVANLRGELQLCVSLAPLLAVDADAPQAAAGARPRLAVIEQGGERWAFPVEELLGVRRVPQAALAPPPATVSRDAAALTRALFELDGERIALLDADLLFARLRKAVA